MKRFILLSLLTIMTGTIAATTYEGLLQNFKEQLYNHQTGLMKNKEHYFAFITPLLKQAETQLRIPKYLKQNPKHPLVQKYFSCLMACNLICFKYYIEDKTVDDILNDRYLDIGFIAFDGTHSFKALYTIIPDIMASMPDHFEKNSEQVEKEISDTIKFFYNANVAYYKQLPWYKKLAIAC
jgi:hypothetical protein